MRGRLVFLFIQPTSAGPRGEGQRLTKRLLNVANRLVNVARTLPPVHRIPPLATSVEAHALWMTLEQRRRRLSDQSQAIATSGLDAPVERATEAGAWIHRLEL